MIAKGSKLYSIFHMRCPRCHEGEFFVAHPYNLKKVGDLHPTCPKCGLKYEKEIGFYFGAMYVSYGMGVALFVVMWLGFNLFFPYASTALQIAIISAVSLLVGPYFYALSKIIWANLFFGYDKHAIAVYRKEREEETHS
jgi:uncharacterized protein (DUF983 family)